MLPFNMQNKKDEVVWNIITGKKLFQSKMPIPVMYSCKLQKKQYEVIWWSKEKKSNQNRSKDDELGKKMQSDI